MPVPRLMITLEWKLHILRICFLPKSITSTRVLEILFRSICVHPPEQSDLQKEGTVNSRGSIMYGACFRIFVGVVAHDLSKTRTEL